MALVTDFFTAPAGNVTVSDSVAIWTSLTKYPTLKPVCNDHLYNKIHYLWFIQ